MANKSLKLAMQREYGYKQLKRYLSLECGMSEKIRVKISDANIIWIQGRSGLSNIGGAN